MSIAVLCPSRDNPDDTMLAFQSMLDTSDDTDMIICVDEDQVDMYRLPKHPRMLISVGPRTDIVGSLNLALRNIPPYESYGLIVDDARFTTPGWDAWLKETINEFPNRLGVVSASHNVGAFVNFAYVSREWVELLGWYACPKTAHFCWDTVMEMLGEATRIVYAPKDKFHIHHDLKRNDKTIPVFAKDSLQFLGWCVNERRRLVNQIREAMAA